jgi:hypothetical protein
VRLALRVVLHPFSHLVFGLVALHELQAFFFFFSHIPEILSCADAFFFFFSLFISSIQYFFSFVLLL